ncbi:MAG: hypothetical protein H6722_22035 [Sandaracinus sp.]|nr:hypothetical protein [Sandaracinus sp.]
MAPPDPLDPEVVAAEESVVGWKKKTRGVRFVAPNRARRRRVAVTLGVVVRGRGGAVVVLALALRARSERHA